MTPRINYKLKGQKLLIRIVIHGQGKGLYDTGITVNPDLWDEEKEICGDPSVQQWMLSTRDTLLNSFRPDMTPKRLWMSFINNVSDTKATIKDAFEYYLENMPLRENTKLVYISVGRSLQRAGIYETPLNEIKPHLLRTFMNSLKISDASKFNTFTRLKAAVVRYTKDHQLNLSIDFTGLIKKPRHVMKENQWLTLDEVQKLLDQPFKWAKKDARDLFCLCCFTGMSMSDALVFDPRKNVRTIDGRDYVVFKRIKTGSLCKIPLIKQAKDIIISRAWPVRMNGRSFQYHVSNFDEIIGRDINTHMARKTAGALFLEFGFSIESVASFLGHSTINLTQRTYTTITSKKVVNEIDRVMSAGLVQFA